VPALWCDGDGRAGLGLHSATLDVGDGYVRELWILSATAAGRRL
jgi:hypothetical protein